MGALSDRVKAKYPQYKNIPDDELESRVTAKYPQYKSFSGTEKPSISGFVNNLGKSTLNVIKGTGSAILNAFNPNPDKNTISQTGRLAHGVMQKLDPTKGNKIANTVVKSIPFVGNIQKANELSGKDTNYEQMADNAGQFYKKRYGGVENIKKTLYEDPVGAALDVAAVVDVASAPFRMGGKASATVKAAKTGEMTAGEKILTRGLGNPAKQSKLVDRYGYRNVADFISKNKLYSRDPKKLQELLDSLNEQYNSLALKSDVNVSVKGILKGIDDDIKRLVSVDDVNTDWGQQKLKTLLEQRQKVVDRFGNPNSDITGMANGELQAPVKDVTLFRRALDKDIPQGAFDVALDTNKGKTAGLRSTRGALKELINSTDPRLKKLGDDISYAYRVKPIFEGAQSRGANRQMLNFTKLGSAGIGAFTRGIPGAIGGFFTEQIVNNPYVLAGLGYLADKSPTQFYKLTGITADSFKAANIGRLATDSTTDQSAIKQKLFQRQLGSQQ